MANRLEGDYVFPGRVSPAAFDPPASCITDAAVHAAANVSATKLQHQHQKGFAQGSSTVASSARQVVHVAHGEGTVIEFRAGSVVVCVGAATLVFNLLKNGVSILPGTITLDNTNSVRVTELVSVVSGSYVAGDVFEIDLVATAGGGTLGQGAFASAMFREKAA